MALSIRNPVAEKLALEVARKTGESLTQAVVHALEEKLQRIEGHRAPTDLYAAFFGFYFLITAINPVSVPITPASAVRIPRMWSRLSFRSDRSAERSVEMPASVRT